ncbi:LysR family transcriptional regulator [Bordetella muralis]|uniref:LysR family transcriptional regulator n=1 Tax=Bordetella muralis TaxID=1649130 RepID=UPI0039EEE85E
MNIKYRQLQAFTLAAKLGSFAKAAEELCITQPSFSVQIRELEHDLGLQLFERTTRSCRLTPAGATFHREIAPILHDLRQAYGRAIDVGAGRSGQLLLSALPSLSFGLLTEVLGRFNQDYPNVRIRMREELNVAVIESVKRGEVELGVGSELNGDPELGFMQLFHDDLVVVAPVQHAIFDEPLKWHRVGDYPLIMLAMGSADRAILANRPGITPAIEVAYMGTAVSMVRNGMGITILPSSALKGVDMEGLQAQALPGKDCRRTIGVLYRKRAPLSTIAHAFVHLLQKSAATVSAG